MVADPEAWLACWLETRTGDENARAEAHRRAREADPDRYLVLATWYLALDRRAPQRTVFLTQLFSLGIGGVRLSWLLSKHVNPLELSTAIKAHRQSGRRLRRPQTRAVTDYLFSMERDADRFDRTVVLHKSSLKHLYTSFHVQPGARANKVLFANRVPEHSRIWAAKTLARTTDPAMQAALIAAHGLTLVEVRAMIGNPSSTCWPAILEHTPAAELRSELRYLRDNGGLDSVEMRTRVAEKLGGDVALSRALRALSRSFGEADRDWVLDGLGADTLAKKLFTVED